MSSSRGERLGREENQAGCETVWSVITEEILEITTGIFSGQARERKNSSS